MKLFSLKPQTETRDSEVENVINYLSQDGPELDTGLVENFDSLESSIQRLKESSTEYLDKYKNETDTAKRADILSDAIFAAAQYRDTKYAIANRKYLFGLGYRNAMIFSGRTVFSKSQLSKNAED